LGVDPLAGKYPKFSPYNYSLNNPLVIVDPNGMETDWYLTNNGVPTFDPNVQSQEDINSDEFYIGDAGQAINEQTGELYQLNSDGSSTSGPIVLGEAAPTSSVDAASNNKTISDINMVAGAAGSARGLTDEIINLTGEAKSLGAYTSATKILGKGLAGVSVISGLVTLSRSHGSNRDYAKAIVNTGIAATGFIPVVGPVISIGLGIIDYYGGFDNLIYNRFSDK
jgi:hypothetical protein